ncbi:uncharacterized protein LOC128954690 [Oppia nitens]|uniref:uncharacterized protein LOC128954690 n=1 Tax=Oppia nitens TaxID=1686743 RepID=UPI0023DAF73E|nr:uncharacterized protein LOC128954690 [Oppia nitens]
MVQNNDPSTPSPLKIDDHGTFGYSIEASAPLSMDTTTTTTITPKVGDFRDQLTEVMDQGSHGMIYKVRYPQTNRSYAVKIATLHAGEDSNVLEWEINYLMSARSKYVTTYFDHEIIGDQLFLLMDISAGNLHHLLDAKPGICRRKPGDPIGVPEFYLTAWLFKLLLEAVNHIHSLEPKIIHRDIKPENILIEVNGFGNSYVKLCDFGIATHQPNSDKLKNSTNIGTGHYMAPEVAVSGRDYDYRADIYSVAVVSAELFELYGDNNDIDILAACDSSLLKPGAYCRERLTKIYDWLCRMHSTNPADRPDCRQVLADFDNWNFPMSKIMTIWMANYNDRFWKLVPPVTPDQPNEDNG